jgi:serine/threonine protein kinase
VALASGTRLGPYEVIAQIDAGGMGEVYKARDTRLDRFVAIKVLPPGVADHPVRRDRFDREARIISSLNHPHICTLYDVGHQDGDAYLVMELIEAQTLAERLAKGPLPLQQAFEYAIQIAEALDAAHRCGIVHRDLKPTNVMLTKAGVKLLDFGVAKMKQKGTTTSSTLTAEGMLVGTLHYMAPEQFDGREADARSDIFAFGAVLFEMLTGARAFAGQNPSTVIASDA